MRKPVPTREPAQRPSPTPKSTRPIQHIVIIVKENHTFDNYFGRFPGADGDPNLALAADPPLVDHPHDHAAWLRRATGGAKEQYAQANIPNYWRYAQRYTLCDRYFTEVAGPSTPNHLMLIAANSPIIDNPHYRDPIRDQPPFDIASLPAKLAKAGLTWRNYGGYAHGYITALKGSKDNVSADRFAKDAAAGKLPAVSWSYGPKGWAENRANPVRPGKKGTAVRGEASARAVWWATRDTLITGKNGAAWSNMSSHR